MVRVSETRSWQGTTVLMAGWLFADLMLVLFVVGMGSPSIAYPAVPPPAVATPDASPTPVPTPTPTPTPTRPAALATDPVVLKVKVSFADLQGSGDARKRARASLKKQVLDGLAKYQGDRAGMVLVWAYHSDVDYAVTVAQSVADELPKISKKFFGDTNMRPLWHGAGAASRVDLEIYIFQ